MLIRHLIFTFFVAAATSFAQRAGFETGDGKTSIFLSDSGALNFNVADTSIRFGYVRRVSTDPLIWGFELFGKPSNGVADFFSKGKPANEGGGALSFGRHNFLAKDIDDQDGCEVVKDDWFVVQGGYRRASFNNFPKSGLAPNNRKRNFDGYSGTVSYNARMALKGNGTGILAGVTTGVERRNNLDDLLPVTIETNVASAVTASQPTVAKQVRTGYFGDYKEYVSVPVYTDLIFLPLKFNSRIAFDLFTRSAVAGDNRSFAPGVGVFYTKKDSPTKVIGGISASYKDGNLRLGLVAGFNF